MKKNIGILMGGYSSEYNISLKSGEVVFNTLLKSSHFYPYRIHILKNKWVVLDAVKKEHPIDKNDFSTIINNEKIQFDVIFNAIHGTPGEDGKILAYIELLGIKHTSAPFYQMALTFNKQNTLSIAKANGFAIAKSIFISKNQPYSIDYILNEIGLPCFVKPNRSGSSFGVSKVNTFKEIQSAIELAFREDHQIIIESFIDGIEVSIGVIEYENKIKALPITEIVPTDSFFDFKAKYLGNSKEITPARITEQQKNKVSNQAIALYKILNMKGFSRSEFILIDNIPYFLEINSVPGLTYDSILPKQATCQGISLLELFENAIKLA